MEILTAPELRIIQHEKLEKVNNQMRRSWYGFLDGKHAESILT
jgi:hypothetical protein